MTCSVIFVERVAEVVRRVRIHWMKCLKCRPRQTVKSREFRVLVSFFAAREDNSIGIEPSRKESVGHHKDLCKFDSHVAFSVDINSTGVQKGVGKKQYLIHWSSGQTTEELKRLIRNGIIEVVADSGEYSNSNGTGQLASFDQPMGVCTDRVYSFVTDSQIGTIKLVAIITTVTLLLLLRYCYVSTTSWTAVPSVKKNELIFYSRHSKVVYFVYHFWSYHRLNLRLIWNRSVKY